MIGSNFVTIPHDAVLGGWKRGKANLEPSEFKLETQDDVKLRNAKLVSDVLTCSPAKFDGPVEICLTHSAVSSEGLEFWTQATPEDRWEKLPNARFAIAGDDGTRGFATVLVDHFSRFAIFDVPPVARINDEWLAHFESRCTSASSLRERWDMFMSHRCAFEKKAIPSLISPLPSHRREDRPHRSLPDQNRTRTFL